MDKQLDKLKKKNTDAFYAKYKNWIDKNRDFYNKNKNVLKEWLENSRKISLWKGSIRKFEWQAGQLKNNHNMNTVMWTLRGSGVRVKRLDYSPTIVAMSMIPIYGPESRLFTPREICRLQSFPETFIMDTNDKNVYKQMGNAVNVKMISKCIEFLIENKPFN
jgi:DNA (cytosine-5)-methyltransferase 1